MGRRLELSAGARLDRYELMFPLAEGGMAAVWLARLRGKRGFEQLVAIKTIKEHLSEDVRFEEMFLDEARIASRIRHPNVGQILDLGEEAGVLYLVMEWIDGESLARTRRAVEKRGRKIPLPLCLRIMADVAGGLHAAHELTDDAGANLGVIHRDVSPQNILVANSGAVKLIDFGIAKARNRAVAETTDGLVKGKVAYMSPEQANGLPLDRRSDVWAVGVCLYELLSGRLPFDGESQQEILRLLVRGTALPPLPTAIPAVVRGVVEQALAREPDNRFLTAAALERALEGALVSLDALATTEDLARFLRDACPERAKARSDVLASVERVTETLEGRVTRDVTPPGSEKISSGAGLSGSVDVRFSEPPPTAAEIATLHSASVSRAVPEPENRPRRRRSSLLAAVALLILLLGVVVVALRREAPPLDPSPAAGSSAAGSSAAGSSAAGSSAAGSSSPAPAAPSLDASPSPTASTPAPSSTPTPPTSLTTEPLTPSSSAPAKKLLPVRPRAAGSARGTASAPTLPAYDADGIPLGPKKER